MYAAPWSKVIGSPPDTPASQFMHEEARHPRGLALAWADSTYVNVEDQYYCTSIVTAIAIQAMATYGERRSPAQPYEIEMRGASFSTCDATENERHGLTYTSRHPEQAQEPAHARAKSRQALTSWAKRAGSGTANMDVPFLVPIYQARCDSTDVRACADKEKNNE